MCACQMSPEPDNPVDSKAIYLSVEYIMNGKYIVREALDAVHNALEKKLIIDISIDWIKYIVHWSRSSPGWYAGVKITKQGKWPKEAISSVCTLFPLTIIVMTLFHHTLL